MSEQNSILDKIIESKQISEATQFNPSEVVNQLFKDLSSKEQDILHRRFGLFGKPKETLEQIGRQYQITRERIRQIEVTTVKKLRELETFRRQIETAEGTITHLLESHGGVMEETHLIDELLTYPEPNDTNRRSALFIVDNLLADRIDRIKSDPDFLPGWKLKAAKVEIIKEAINELTAIIKQYNRLLKIEELLEKFKQRDFFVKNQPLLAGAQLGDLDQAIDTVERSLHSFLRISKHVDQNILGEWGLSKWQTVIPKRMSDKAYLVLRKTGEPLHFNDITNLINETAFDKKIAYPATIHNELILDERYVLVGRGIYALKEWGYEPGTVLDVIVGILKKAGKPMTKDEIVEAVLKQRIVRKSTIFLALTNRDKIKKLPDGAYTLA